MTQLSEYLAFYDPAQIKVMDYDYISTEPDAFVNEILEWLGLPGDFSHPLIGKRIHDSRRKMRPNRLGLVFWEDQVRRRRLRKYLPYIVGSPIPPPVWNPELRSRVEEYLRPEAEAIREFSGLEFAEWSI
jgi:hypothetical protein